MAQFDVCRNRNPASRARFPYVLEGQADLVSELATAVFVPVARLSDTQEWRVGSLMPTLEIGGRRHRLVTPQLAAIDKRQLGPVVQNLADQRSAIIGALDVLITGI